MANKKKMYDKTSITDNTNILVRINKELKDEMDKYCVEQGISYALFIRKSIEHTLKNKIIEI